MEKIAMTRGEAWQNAFLLDLMVEINRFDESVSLLLNLVKVSDRTQRVIEGGARVVKG
jgi:hypothetical protein